MSTLVNDETLLDDMAASVSMLRGYFMVLAEHDDKLDVEALDGLIARYTAETGRQPPSPWSE